MALDTHKKQTAARRPIETARREAKRAAAHARLEGRPTMARELEQIAEHLREVKAKTVKA
jgi:hypothetical protein